MKFSATNLACSGAVAVRRLWPAEQDAFCAHFQRLDARSRALRFGGAVHDSFIASYARSAFAGGNMVLGAFVAGELRGVGEVKPRLDTWPWRAEAAFSVEPAWQNRGIGALLLERIVSVAQNRGISQIDLWCRADNTTMRHLAGKFGARRHVHETDMRAALAVSGPTPASFMEEIFGEALACTGCLIETGRRLAGLDAAPMSHALTGPGRARASSPPAMGARQPVSRQG